MLPGATWHYTVLRQVINQINALEPGQDLNLQAYVLVTGTNPAYTTNKDRWNCTNPNPAYHWSNDAERYCFADFQRIGTAIQNNPNVVVSRWREGILWSRTGTWPWFGVDREPHGRGLGRT